jgi:hypothetical protein
MDREMKTMIIEIREDTAGIRDDNKVLRKESAAVREQKGELRKEFRPVREEKRGREEKWQAEEVDWMKRMKMIEEKVEQREKNEKKNNVIITGIGGVRGNMRKYREGVEKWFEWEIGVKVNVKEAFKINKGKMMLTKIESWEQKKNIMLNKSNLKERKGEKMTI